MKKVSSVVWQFFERIEQNKRCVAVLCKLCDSEYKYFGNTTNLRSHLMKKHPLQWGLRQENWDSQKTEPSSGDNFEDDDASNQSTVSPRRKTSTGVRNDKNVRYSLTIKKSDNGTTGEDAIPKIEIQRVDVRQHKLVDEDDDEEAVATENLVRQMHGIGSDEEWLEEDYQNLTEVYEPPRKKRMHRKIKREVVTPTQRTRPKYFVCSPQSETQGQIVIDKAKHDEFSVFGEYIANKLRKFKAPRTRGNIQQLITTILWQAEYGMYDNAQAVKRILMSNVPEEHSQHRACDHSEVAHTEEVDSQEMDVNQSTEVEEIGEEIMN